MGLHLSRSIRIIRRTFENRSFQQNVKACYSVSSAYVEGQSLLFFSRAPEKWGYRTPTSKSGVYPKVTPMDMPIFSKTVREFHENVPIVFFSLVYLK